MSAIVEGPACQSRPHSAKRSLYTQALRHAYSQSLLNASNDVLGGGPSDGPKTALIAGDPNRSWCNIPATKHY